MRARSPTPGRVEDPFYELRISPILGSSYPLILHVRACIVSGHLIRQADRAKLNRKIPSVA
jgi:hypothetical protein